MRSRNESPAHQNSSRRLNRNFHKSYEADPSKINEQNHGAVTGAAQAEGLAEDLQLAKAVEVLKDDAVWDNLLKKYPKDVHETQVAATENTANEDLSQKKKAGPKEQVPVDQPTEAPKDAPAPAPAPESQPQP